MYSELEVTPHGDSGCARHRLDGGRQVPRSPLVGPQFSVLNNSRRFPQVLCNGGEPNFTIPHDNLRIRLTTLDFTY